MTDRTITVTGTASKEAQHEHIVVTLRTHAEADQAIEAQEKAADTASTLREDLDSQGITDEAIETQKFELTHRSERRDTTPEDPEYRAEETLVVRCDPDESTAVVAAGSAVGASVRSVRPGLSAETRATMSEEAVEAAVKDARETAETIAAADEERVGRLLTADHSSDKRSGAFCDPAASTDWVLSPGPIELAKEVTATFEMLD